MRIALIMADERDGHREYDKPLPYFAADLAARLDGLRVNKALEIHIISCVREPFPEVRLDDNVFYHPVYVTAGVRKGLCLQHIRRVRKKVKEIRPDVVDGFGTEYYMALCAAFSGYRNTITMLGNVRAIAKKKRYKPFPAMLLSAVFEWVALRKTDAVFCSSEYTSRQVGALCKRKWVVRAPVRLPFFNIPRSVTAPPMLLCIGIVVPYKNQRGLIRALDSFAQEYNFSLCFIGRLGSDLDYSRSFAQDVEQRPWCQHIGEVDVDHLMDLLGHAQAMIHPSIEDAFPNTVIEAMAAGVPVAVSSVTGTAEIIVHGENGLVFDPSDERDIQSAVLQLLDKEVALHLSGKCRATAKQELLPDCIAKQQVGYYQKLVYGR